jgi:hypothetical protein
MPTPIPKTAERLVMIIAASPKAGPAEAYCAQGPKANEPGLGRFPVNVFLVKASSTKEFAASLHGSPGGETSRRGVVA